MSALLWVDRKNNHWVTLEALFLWTLTRAEFTIIKKSPFTTHIGFPDTTCCINTFYSCAFTPVFSQAPLPKLGFLTVTNWLPKYKAVPSLYWLRAEALRVVVRTVAFHARVRGLFPGLGGLKETKLLIPHPFGKLSIVGSLHDREVACSASYLQGLNFESCVWKAVSSHSFHHPQEVLLPYLSMYAHKSGIKPDSFHFIYILVQAHLQLKLAVAIPGLYGETITEYNGRDRTSIRQPKKYCRQYSIEEEIRCKGETQGCESFQGGYMDITSLVVLRRLRLLYKGK